MDWHVQYRQGGTDHLVMFPSPEAAVENACRLIDEGHDVFAIGTGDLTELDRTGTDRPDLRLVDESEVSVRPDERRKSNALTVRISVVFARAFCHAPFRQWCSRLATALAASFSASCRVAYEQGERTRIWSPSQTVQRYLDSRKGSATMLKVNGCFSPVSWYMPVITPICGGSG